MKDTGKIVTNTKAVADYFGKEHFRVVSVTKTLAPKLEDGWSSIVAAELEVSVGGGGAIRTIKGYNLTYIGAKALVESFTGAKAKEQAIKFLEKVAEPPDITPVMQLIYPELYPTTPAPPPKQPPPMQPEAIEGEYIHVETPASTREWESMKVFASKQQDTVDELKAQVEDLESRLRSMAITFSSNGLLSNVHSTLETLAQCVFDARKSEDVLVAFRQEVDVYEHKKEDYISSPTGKIRPVLSTRVVDAHLRTQANKHPPDNAVEILLRDFQKKIK